jgi:DNA-binding response OmpR family regulator/HPt (histidine-containing phosphotransfer) domain-containing protein
MKILLVEDDEQTATALTKSLTAQHYLVNAVDDGQSALELAEAFDYDLIVLDVVLPSLDGISLCRKLRAGGSRTPILLLTAKDSAHDRVLGLEAGADDYVTKPYDMAELLARIRALLRRGNSLPSHVLTWENLQLDPEIGAVTYQGTLLHLTPKEYGLLELFLRHPQRIFSRSSLLNQVWSIGEFPGEGAVNTQIKGLRQKLKAAGMSAELIETIYGLGYRLKPPEEEQETAAGSRETEKSENTENSTSKTQNPTRKTSTPETPSSEAEAKVLAVMAALREDFKQVFPERVAVFERAIAQLSDGDLDRELQQTAQAEAHRLIGSLGALDLRDAAIAAQQLEQFFQSELTSLPAAAQNLNQLVQTLKQSLEVSNRELGARNQGLRGKEPVGEKAGRDAITRQHEDMDRNNGTSLASVRPPLSALFPRILVIDDDAVLTEQLKTEAISWGVQVEVAADPTTAKAKIVAHQPDAILLDLSFSDSNESGLTLLAELTRQHPKIPVLVFTARNQLSDRVEVARLGGQGFLHKPIASDQVFQVVMQVMTQSHVFEPSVLIVDDDPLVLKALAALLAPWGFQITTLADPNQFWEVLELVIPDLLILDVEMPQFSGIELCQAVRNDPRWNQMPILFLSAHNDVGTIHQVFSVGADDYVAKPVAGPELIARVLNRLERMQILRKLAGTREQAIHG